MSTRISKLFSLFHNFLYQTYDLYIKPKSKNEDVARREFIFNVLVLGFAVLTGTAFVITMFYLAGHQRTSKDISYLTTLIPLIILLALYKLSRIRFRNWIVYVFILIYLLIGTYSLYIYSYVLPQGLLIYVLVIIMSGILISARASLFMTLATLVSLTGLAYVQINHLYTPNTEDLYKPIPNVDLIVYIVIFSIIFLVSWLSSREIDRSLARARKSEAELRIERNSLERKVQERTQQLEKSQVEKSLELYRFAEFGRLSSTLLHDIVNPLTAASLDLEQLENNQQSRVVTQIRHSIDYMEQYIQSARRQLRSQSEIKRFDSSIEIKRVNSFLASKAKAERVKVKCNLAENAELFGDSTKFSQIIANLIGNAIDAYSDIKSVTKRTVTVTTIKAEENLVISITDHGSGIPTKEISRIFDPFFTTKANDRGTGIGLTIVKKIIEEDFRGVISVTSSKDVGTSFTVALPINALLVANKTHTTSK